MLFIIEWDSVMVRGRLLCLTCIQSPGCYFRILDVLVSKLSCTRKCGNENSINFEPI